MRRTPLLLLTALWVPSVAAAQDVLPGQKHTAADEKLLRAANVPTDGPGLLEFFRKRVLSEADAKRVPELIEKLGSGRFQEREKAAEELIALGPAVRPHLARALEHKDAEVRRRAAACVEAIDRAASSTVRSRR